MNNTSSLEEKCKRGSLNYRRPPINPFINTIQITSAELRKANPRPIALENKGRLRKFVVGINSQRSQSRREATRTASGKPKSVGEEIGDLKENFLNVKKYSAPERRMKSSTLKQPMLPMRKVVNHTQTDFSEED